MEFHAMGMNIRHEGDFCIDRPSGSGDNLLVVFKSTAFVTVDGNEISVSPNSAILYRKGSNQLYRTCGQVYINHFLHMDCEDGDFVINSELKFDTVFKINDVSAIENLLEMIGREAMSEQRNKTSYIDLLIKMLLLKLTENASDVGLSPEISKHVNELNALRAEIYSNAGRFKSIAELAERVNISPSHFQQLYHAQFGISCYEDILAARVQMACYYLSSTAISIKEVAAICGYENDVCFMRRFKQRVGKTPSEYRATKAV